MLKQFRTGIGYPPCRYGRIFERVLFCLSIVCLTTGIVVGVGVLKSDEFDRDILYAYPHRKDNRTTAWAVFYYGFLPFITLCVSGVSIVMHQFHRGNCFYSLVVAIMFSVGWWIANGFFIQCDFVHLYDSGLSSCPQRILEFQIEQMGGVSYAAIGVKSTAGILIGIIYLIYLGYAAKGVSDYQKLQKTRLEDIQLTRKVGEDRHEDKN